MGPNVAERTSEREALATAPLSPGMAAQVEVVRRVSERSGGSIARRTGGSIARRTGRRSVLSYLLSPIARATSEAGRER